MSEPTDLLPLLVEGFGRGGSTLAMQLLGTSPRIAFDRQPPCENRYLLYLIRLAELLRRPQEDDAEWGMEELMWNPGSRVGAPPWPQRELLARPPDGEEFAARALRALWSEFSRLAATNTCPSDPGSVRYYAEKSPQWVVDAVASLGPRHVIVLIRDPRDVWLSIRAFADRRGFHDLRRYASASEEERLADFLDFARAHLDRALSVDATANERLVRYEEMVDDLHEVARALSEWLDVELDADAVPRQGGGLSSHMTSASPTRSVARWRREMDDALIRRFEHELGDRMSALGYV